MPRDDLRMNGNLCQDLHLEICGWTETKLIQIHYLRRQYHMNWWKEKKRRRKSSWMDFRSNILTPWIGSFRNNSMESFSQTIRWKNGRGGRKILLSSSSLTKLTDWENEFLEVEEIGQLNDLISHLFVCQVYQMDKLSLGVQQTLWENEAVDFIGNSTQNALK